MRKISNFTEDDILNSFLEPEDFIDLALDDPLFTEDQYFLENPHLHIFNVMRQPENFPFTCKHLLNFDLLPYQHVILSEMWNSPFPLLVASRGASKCITKDSLLFSNEGIKYIYELLPSNMVPITKYASDVVLSGENGQNKVEYGWLNGKTKTIKINTRQGYIIEGTLDHPIRIVRGGEIRWVELKDINIDDYVIIGRDEQSFSNLHSDVNGDIAWMLGLLVGNGHVSSKNRIMLTSADKDIIDRYTSIIFRLNAKRIKKYGKYDYQTNDQTFHNLINDVFGLDRRKSHDKMIPKKIRESGSKNIASFLCGLFDADGHIDARGRIGFSTVSKLLAHQVHICLLSFGIISRLKLRTVKYKGTRRPYYSIIISNFDGIQKYHKHIGFFCERKREKLEHFVSGALNRNPNIDVIPKELINHHIYELKKNHIISGHGYSYNRGLISPNRSNRYNRSYHTLSKIVDIFENQGDHPSLSAMKDIIKKNYFYDTVEFIESSENETYDFYIPNDHTFISNGFISHNTSLLGIYTILKTLFQQGIKVVICGAAFRQSKMVLEYVESVLDNAPLLKDLVKGLGTTQLIRKDTDKWTFRLGNSTASSVPVGDGSKIRGMRANLIIADEFRSINERIFEEVIRGFASVANNPAQNARRIMKAKKMAKLGYQIPHKKNQNFNQTIISGTAGYIFETFGKYWKRYHSILESKGDANKLLQLLGKEPERGFDWKDYSIIRIPYELIPEGFMDEKQIAQAQASTTKSSYMLEYGAVFVEDSEGFFRRKLIESCTAYDETPVLLNGRAITFSAKIFGDVSKKYIIGVDPASESDNFSIVVLEVHGDHRRVVYCWTMTRDRFKAKIKKGIAMGEDDFYDYCSRKIRELMKIFPCEHIAIDKMGGGIGIIEALQNKKQLKEGESPIYSYIRYGNNDPFFWEKEENETDRLAGLHILHICQFANADFVSQANHGMKHDLENRKLLFPFMDPISLEIALEQDKDFQKAGRDTRVYDSLEDCMMEIQELKDELATIVHTQTPNSGRERWDTPEIKLEGGKKGRDRKDRYSALLLANMVARTLNSGIEIPEYVGEGGFARDLVSNEQSNSAPQKMYSGNAMWDIDTSFYTSVNRNRN